MTSSEAPQGLLPTARRFLQLVLQKDFGPAALLLQPDVVYRVPGRSALAGTFSGRDAVVRHLDAVFERADGGVDAIQWEDWLVGVSHVGALLHLHLESRGRRHNDRVFFLLAFGSGGTIADIRLSFDDQEDFDALIGV